MTRFKPVILLLFTLLISACAVSPTAAPPADRQPLPTTAVRPTTPAPSAGADASATPEPLARPTRRLSAGELQLATDIDAIPAIFAEETMFLDAASGSQEWGDDELVIALALNGRAKAYPVRLLSLHEIVNDHFGEQPVLVTWCPLCFSAIAFDPVVDGRALTFGVSGYLYNDNLVMYDHQSNTLWSQLVGEAVRGGMRGTQLRIFPSLMTSWGEWKRLHPESLILSAARLGNPADEIIDPYAGYYTSGAAGFSSGQEQDGRLPPKSLVVGLVVGNEARAYPLAVMQAEGILNDQLGLLPILLVFNTGLETVLVSSREVDGRVLTFAFEETTGNLIDKETGTVWDSASGAALSGSLAGEALTPLSGPLVFWFAWTGFHPNTTVYGGE